MPRYAATKKRYGVDRAPASMRGEFNNWVVYDYDKGMVARTTSGKLAYFPTRRDAEDWVNSTALVAQYGHARTRDRAARRRGVR